MFALAAPDWQLFLAALLASLAVVFTPGPNNVIVAAIGASRGFRHAVPYSLGVAFGHPLILAAIGLGLGNLIRVYPAIHTFVQFAGVGFLFYLAWRIASAPPLDMTKKNTAEQTVPGFFYSLAFQWLNPKGISYAFSLVAVYTRPHALLTDVLMLMLLSGILSLASTLTWTLAGVAIGKFLNTKRRQRTFNIIMGALLFLAALAIWRG